MRRFLLDDAQDRLRRRLHEMGYGDQEIAERLLIKQATVNEWRKVRRLRSNSVCYGISRHKAKLLLHAYRAKLSIGAMAKATGFARYEAGRFVRGTGLPAPHDTQMKGAAADAVAVKFDL